MRPRGTLPITGSTQPGLGEAEFACKTIRSETTPCPRADSKATHWLPLYTSPTQWFAVAEFVMPEATLASNAASSASTVFRIAARSLAGEMFACVAIVVVVVVSLARRLAWPARRRAIASRFRAAAALFWVAERRSAAAVSEPELL